MNFHRQTAEVLARLDDEKAFQEWKDAGGQERLKRLFDEIGVHSYHHPDEWHESVWSIGRAVPLRKHSQPSPEPPIDRVTIPFGTGKGEACGVGPLADADDQGVYDIASDPIWLLGAERERTMLEIMARDTGNSVSAERAAEAIARHEELKRQNAEIAQRLESQGFPAYRSTPFGLYTYFVHSRTVVRNDQFRRIMFLPLVAQRVRRPKLVAVEYFCQRNPFARMWTFTSGPRTDLYSLRERVAWFHRRVSKFAAWLRDKHRIEVVFRSTELGTPERSTEGSPNDNAGAIERDEQGRPTFHVHAHCLVRSLDGSKPRHVWERILRAVWRRWGFHWDDGSSIDDARELVKYMCKPGAVLSLTAAETAELARQLDRLRLVVPMGSLRAEMRDRKDRCRILDRQPTPDGPVWREVADWNRHGKRPKPARNQDEAVEAAIRWKPKDNDPPTRIVARLAPAFAPGSLVAEPRVVVLAGQWRESEVVACREVAELRDPTADAWEFARAAAIRVHVCTPTVPGEFAPAVDWLSRAPPDPVPLWKTDQIDAIR